MRFLNKCGWNTEATTISAARLWAAVITWIVDADFSLWAWEASNAATELSHNTNSKAVRGDTTRAFWVVDTDLTLRTLEAGQAATVMRGRSRSWSCGRLSWARWY